MQLPQAIASVLAWAHAHVSRCCPVRLAGGSESRGVLMPKGGGSGGRERGEGSGGTWHSGMAGQQHRRPALSNLFDAGHDAHDAHGSLAAVISRVRPWLHWQSCDLLVSLLATLSGHPVKYQASAWC